MYNTTLLDDLPKDQTQIGGGNLFHFLKQVCFAWEQNPDVEAE